MKNSAWYHKLWRKKLGGYPLKDDDVTSSWAEMRSMLDEHLPESDQDISNKPAKFFGGTIISMLGFILPAAAMIGVISYVAVKHPFKKEVIQKHHNHYSGVKKLNNAISADSLTMDTVKNASLSDSTRNHNESALAAVSAKLEIPKQATGAENIITKNNSEKLSSEGSPKHHSSQANITRNKTETSSSNRVGLHKNNISDPLVAEVNIQEGNSAVNNQAIGVNKSDLNLSAKADTNDNKTKQLKSISLITADTKKSNEEPSGTSAGSVKDHDTGGTKGKSKIKPVINKPHTTNDGDPLYNYGLDAGLNTNKDGNSLVAGLMGTYALKDKLLLNAGIRINFNKGLSADITHKSYNVPLPGNNLPDSGNSFKVKDTRKLTTLSIPVTLEYKLTNKISVFGGPQVDLSVGQSKHSYKLGTVKSYRDTLSHTNTIDSALLINSINKLNIGISGGISFRFHQLYIDGSYQQNITPYKVSTALGNYQQYYHSFQIGLRYKFKKKKN